ncbi:K(+)-transporting ATPase subunit F [Methylobacterium frigidaeris]|nr:K(+)-transporting ATPase subunit F [Methylobacterium frigidaeris]
MGFTTGSQAPRRSECRAASGPRVTGRGGRPCAGCAPPAGRAASPSTASSAAPPACCRSTSGRCRPPAARLMLVPACRRRSEPRDVPDGAPSLCRLNIARPAPLSNPYAFGWISGNGTVAHGPVRCGGACRVPPDGDTHVRFPDAGGRPGLLRPVAWLRLLVRTPVRRPAMTLDYGLGGLMTLGLLAYLAYALVRPERF